MQKKYKKNNYTRLGLREITLDITHILIKFHFLHYFSNLMSHGPVHNVSKSSTFPAATAGKINLNLYLLRVPTAFLLRPSAMLIEVGAIFLTITRTSTADSRIFKGARQI